MLSFSSSSSSAVADAACGPSMIVCFGDGRMRLKLPGAARCVLRTATRRRSLLFSFGMRAKGDRSSRYELAGGLIYELGAIGHACYDRRPAVEKVGLLLRVVFEGRR